MTKNIFRCSFIATFLASWTVAVAQQPSSSESTTRAGTTAAQFLKIGAGARALGMGGAFVAMDGDLNSIYWNPAGLPLMQGSGGVTFNHGSWLADMNYDVAAGAVQLGGIGTIGLSVISLRVPEDIVRTLQNEEGDGRKFDAGSLAIGITYARSLTDRFSLGISAKYIREQIWNENASTFALDVGTLFITPFHGLRIGASMSNFGGKMRLQGSDLLFNRDPNPNVNGGTENVPSEYRVGEYDLPLFFRVGVAMEVFSFDFLKWTVLLDATHPNDNTEYLGSGFEVNFDDTFFARAGYKSLYLRESEQSLTWGLGLRLSTTDNIAVLLDYAFADYGRLSNVHYLSASLTF